MSLFVRLAYLRHAASVRSELGSNSQKNLFCFYRKDKTEIDHSFHLQFLESEFNSVLIFQRSKSCVFYASMDKIASTKGVVNMTEVKEEKRDSFYAVSNFWWTAITRSFMLSG